MGDSNNQDPDADPEIGWFILHEHPRKGPPISQNGNIQLGHLGLMSRLKGDWRRLLHLHTKLGRQQASLIWGDPFKGFRAPLKGFGIYRRQVHS